MAAIGIGRGEAAGEGVGGRPAAAVRALRGRAVGTTVLDIVGAQLPVEGMVPGLEQRALCYVAVVDVLAHVRAADAVALRCDGGRLPAAVAVLRMPRLHQLDAGRHLEAVERRHHFGQGQRQLFPVLARAAERIEPQYADLIAVEFLGEVDVALQVLSTELSSRSLNT